MTDERPIDMGYMSLPAEVQQAAEAGMRCSDPPEESCSDAGCPVHGDRYSDDWWDADERGDDD